MLMAFARAERSSYFDMMEASNTTPDLARRAAYLRHAVDENRHAQMFSLRALELDPTLAFDDSLARADFEHLFTRLGEARFLAFVHLGEKRACAQMVMFRDELASFEGTPRADTKTKALLDAGTISAAEFDELLLYLQRSLNLTVVMITHDLDTLLATCDRVAVLVDRKIVVDTLDGIMSNPHPWIRQYFHGPRARAAQGQKA